MSDSPMMWCSEPRRWPLLGDDVHLWRVSLLVTPARVRMLELTLAPGERQRAARFRFAADRIAYIAGRGELREILGRYLDMRPERVRLGAAPGGKPALIDGAGIRFNVSRSHGVALIALSGVREVGVDVERIRDDLAITSIAERFFSSAERRALDAAAAYRRRDAFFGCWTCKEACVKAAGRGLSLPLDQIDVSPAVTGSVAFAVTRPDAPSGSQWSVRAFTPAPGYRGAVAADGEGWRLLPWRRSG